MSGNGTEAGIIAKRFGEAIGYLKAQKTISGAKDIMQLLHKKRKATISEYINGTNPIPWYMLSLFCNTYGIDEQWIKGITDVFTINGVKVEYQTPPTGIQLKENLWLVITPDSEPLYNTLSDRQGLSIALFLNETPLHVWAIYERDGYKCENVNVQAVIITPPNKSKTNETQNQ